MGTRSRTRMFALAFLAAASLGLSACSGAAPDSKTALPDVKNLPQGVNEHPQLPKDSSSDDSCDPLRSYKPSASKSAKEIKAIIKRGRLRVGVDQTTYLMGYRDPATGKMDGFDVRVAREIAKDLLGDASKIQFVAMTSADREPALENHDVDLVVRTMTINCDRWKNIGFSGEYYAAAQKVLVPNSSDVKDPESDLKGHKVCAAKGSTSINRIKDWGAKPVSVHDWTDCMILIQQGDVDAMTTDDVILAGMAAQDPNTHVIDKALSAEPYGVGANKDDVDLIKYVNHTLDRIRKDGTWEKIYGDTLAKTLGKAKPPKPKYGR
ncbi:MAG TPA: glutamate ABC transporter substrate-binding protein [Stackebrandtia sp.]|nr:glutamate ABC transporter substrate-binding protein [Stackebrandtia sp.]